MLFAFNFRGQPALSVMNRMGQEPSGMPGRGLSGLDGAAQAGIIRYKLQSLGMLHEAILIADIAPRSQPCPCRSSCCSGQMRNQEWSDAINWLSDNVRVNALDGHRTTHPIRRACVEVYFGTKITAVKIAHDLDVSEDTAGVMIRKVRRYLRGEQERALIGADNALSCLVEHTGICVSA
jgi:hypothetical protein